MPSRFLRLTPQGVRTFGAAWSTCRAARVTGPRSASSAGADVRSPWFQATTISTILWSAPRA